MPLTLIHLQVWQCANALDHGLHNHFNLGYSQFLYPNVILPTLVLGVTLPLFTPSCSFQRLRLWLILVSSYVHIFLKRRLTPLCIPIIGLSLFIIIALCFSLRVILISKPKHTSNEILIYLHCHSTPTLHNDYTLCLTLALLAGNSQFRFYVFVFIPLSNVPNDKCSNFYLVCLSNSSSLAYSMSLQLWS